MRAHSLALALACLLAGQAAYAQRSLLDYSLSPVVEATDVDGNTLAASSSDLSCECGYVSGFKYQLNAGKLSAVLIACTDATIDADHPAPTSEQPRPLLAPPAPPAAPSCCQPPSPPAAGCPG